MGRSVYCCYCRTFPLLFWRVLGSLEDVSPLVYEWYYPPKVAHMVHLKITLRNWRFPIWDTIIFIGSMLILGSVCFDVYLIALMGDHMWMRLAVPSSVWKDTMEMWTLYNEDIGISLAVATVHHEVKRILATPSPKPLPTEKPLDKPLQKEHGGLHNPLLFTLISGSGPAAWGGGPFSRISMITVSIWVAQLGQVGTTIRWVVKINPANTSWYG